MTNKEAIDAINRECEKTYLLLTCSSEFPRALERSINALEKMDDREIELEELKQKIKAEVIDKIENLRIRYVDGCNMCTSLNCDECNINQFIEDLEQLKEQKIEEKYIDDIKKVIKENIKDAMCGIYFTRNIASDDMTTLYREGKYKVDICYYWSYFEVFGLTESEEEEIATYYHTIYGKRTE